MDRKRYIEGTNAADVYVQLHALRQQLGIGFRKEHDRSLPFADEVFDRWERARQLGFGAGSSIYDSALVFGDVTVGDDVWIGPSTIIDGSGGLHIGDHCTIAVGVQLYTHDNVKQTLTGGRAEIERSPLHIGRCTYIGPNTVVQRGVTIGCHCIIGVGSFVNTDVPDYTIAAGSPARPIGRVIIDGADVRCEYDNARMDEHSQRANEDSPNVSEASPNVTEDVLHRKAS